MTDEVSNPTVYWAELSGDSVLSQRWLDHKNSVGDCIMRQVIIAFSLLLALTACQSGSEEERFQIYIMDSNGENLRVLLDDAEQSYWSPVWSPDGHQIITFVQQIGESHAEIYAIDPVSGDEMQLTDNNRTNWFPVPSPDGQSLVYLSQDGDTSTIEIRMLNMESGEETVLTDNEDFEYGMSWSQDSTRFVFGAELGGEWQIYIMDVATAEFSALDIPQHGNSPSWSLDEEWIVFTSDRDGEDDIYLSRIDGSELQNLTDNEAWDDNPRWSPDSTRIVFVSDRDGSADIFVMDMSDGNLTNLTANFDPPAGFPAWSPDGEQIIFHAERDG